VGNHRIAVSEPCRRSARGEIRDPKPDGASLEPLKGQDCRSRARRGPSEISIPWDPSPGPAGSMDCRLRPRIPKPAGARESRARKGSVETPVSRDPSPWPAGGTGCQHARLGRASSKFRSALEQASPRRGGGQEGKNPSPEELELQGLATAGTASTRIKSPAARSLTFHTNEPESRRGAMGKRKSGTIREDGLDGACIASRGAMGKRKSGTIREDGLDGACIARPRS
jgi:hypothetical protein